MPPPRVSVIVTCFDLGRYLPEALASIRAQTFRDFEICVVNDGSTDALTLRLLADLDADVSVVHSENRGLPAARNLGVSRTSGEYICTVDADDVLDPTLLEKSVARLDADPTLAFVSHWLEAFGDEQWQWTPERCDFPSLLDANTVNGAAVVRRAAVAAVGGWDETLRDGCEDWDFWITLVERGFRGEIIPEILFRYRRRSDSMSRVNFAGDGLTRLYRRLVDKHAETFRTHLQALSVRREADTAANRAFADNLDTRIELAVLPALARARDDLSTAEHLRARWEEQRRREDERHTLHGEVNRLRGESIALGRQAADSRTETDALRGQLDHARADVAHLSGELASTHREIGAFRSSLSWRLTSPLRALGSFVSSIIGRPA